MIKINFALKKVPAGVSDKTGMTSGMIAGFKTDVNLDILKKIPVAKLVALVVISVGAWFFVTTDREENLTRLDAEIADQNNITAKLNEEIAKIAGYEPIKKQLEKDEFTLKTKIETIEKLSSNRLIQYKAAIALSKSISPDIWLTDYSFASEVGVKIQGKALGFGQISDFMKMLNENVYFGGLVLDNSQQEVVLGREIASFSLSNKVNK